MRIDLTKERKVLFATLGISLILIILGILSKDTGVLGNTVILSVFLVVVPQLIFNYMGYREIREIELRFPNFLRDLVESTRAGLPLHKAIIFTSNTDYGPLSKEIKKMANKLSWNINIITVLNQAKERLVRSEALKKIFRILIETYSSGGSIDDTLDSLANTLSTIHETQKDRKSMLNQYVLAMYVISIVFIGIVVGINKLMVPIFKSMAPGAGGPIGEIILNPCESCIYIKNFQCIPCTVYSSLCSMFGVETASISCYYFALFLSMSAIQAIAGGLVAGQIGEGSVRAGIKHSLILLMITIGAFFILVRLRLIGV